jgi:oxygen-independent coproporphyrinogen-3 oxidase
MDAVRTHYRLLPDAEVTLEANPNSADRERFAAYRSAASTGSASASRRRTGVACGCSGAGTRRRTPTAALDAARDAGFEHVSADLIFGWPGQDADTWRRDLEVATSWPVDHLSLYSLIVEPGTPMADAVTRGVLLPLEDDDAATLYEIALAEMPARGFGHYEVANWARGEAARSRHNRLYWRNGEFLGIGAGAHGTVGGVRTMRHLLPATYVEAVEGGESPVSNTEVIDERTARGETMMLGLRLVDEGVGRAAFLARHGESLDAVFGGTIAELVRLGMMTDDGERVLLTPRGLMLANDVCGRFL